MTTETAKRENDEAVPVTDGPSERRWLAWAPPAAALPGWMLLQAGVRELAERGQSPVCVSDLALWWSSREQDLVEAVAWCRCCPLVDACASYAVAAGEPHGVWGGLTSADRRSLR